jgi:hypothetical protein
LPEWGPIRSLTGARAPALHRGKSKPARFEISLQFLGLSPRVKLLLSAAAACAPA